MTRRSRELTPLSALALLGPLILFAAGCGTRAGAGQTRTRLLRSSGKQHRTAPHESQSDWQKKLVPGDEEVQAATIAYLISQKHASDACGSQPCQKGRERHPLIDGREYQFRSEGGFAVAEADDRVIVMSDERYELSTNPPSHELTHFRLKASTLVARAWCIESIETPGTFWTCASGSISTIRLQPFEGTSKCVPFRIVPAGEGLYTIEHDDLNRGTVIVREEQASDGGGINLRCDVRDQEAPPTMQEKFLLRRRIPPSPCDIDLTQLHYAIKQLKSAVYSSKKFSTQIVSACRQAAIAASHVSVNELASEKTELATSMRDASQDLLAAAESRDHFAIF